MSVLTGDYLFLKCFQTASEYATPENIKSASKAIAAVCNSEINQTAFLYRKELNVRRYLRSIMGKTAALFTFSCFLGGSESGCSDELSKIMGKIGYNIGMAFQIVDDVLDYTGSEDVLKKPAGKDLSAGIYTLPLILAYQDSNEKVRIKIKKLLGKKIFRKRSVHKLLQIVKISGGIKAALKTAEKYTNHALKLIELLPDNEYKTIFISVTKKLLQRNY
jgi:heptaprenyl diphosphate synthase